MRHKRIKHMTKKVYTHDKTEERCKKTTT